MGIHFGKFASYAADTRSPNLKRHKHIRPIVPGAIWEIVIVSTAILLYFVGRGLVETEIPLARHNARTVVHFERWLGIFQEPEIQHWVLRHDWLVHVVDSVYIFGHWPVLISTMIWLLWKRSEVFPVYRTALLISGGIGLVIFVTFPVAPPRMFPDLGFVDTVMIHTNAYRVLQPPAFTNEYAAIPSLHVGWNLLMGIALFRNTQHRFWRGFAIIMPIAMYLATILTANHLIVDGMSGSLVVLVSLWAATIIQGRGSGSNPEKKNSPVTVEESTPLDQVRESSTPLPARSSDSSS